MVLIKRMLEQVRVVIEEEEEKARKPIAGMVDWSERLRDVRWFKGGIWMRILLRSP